MMEKIIQRQNEKGDISNLQIAGYIDPTNREYIVHGLQICHNCGKIRQDKMVHDRTNNNSKCGYDNELFSTHL